jgi:hypothetical protein
MNFWGRFTETPATFATLEPCHTEHQAALHIGSTRLRRAS